MGRGRSAARSAAGISAAANVLRAAGVRAGVIVAVLDVAKGAASVALAMRMSGEPVVPAAAGFAAVVGHIYPVWLKFKGRQRRRHGVRRVFRADAACRASVARRVSRRRLADQIHLARFDSRDDGASVHRVRDRLVRGDARRGLGGGGAHRVQTSRQRHAPCRRHRAAVRSARLMATTVAVLGAGSWGTALAVHLGRVGHDVRLWARDRSLRGRDGVAPRQRRVPARRDLSGLGLGDGVDRSRRGRRAARRLRRAVTWRARRHPARAQHLVGARSS